MPKYVMESVPEFSTLPVDAIIQVTCTALKEVMVPGKDGKDDWAKVEFTFVIDAVPSSLQAQCGDLVGSKIWGNISAKFTTHADNKMRQWTAGLLGMDLNEGFELDTDVLINRKARAVIGQYTKQNGSSQHQVKGLLPLVQAAAPTPVAAQRSGDIASEALAARATVAPPVAPVVTDPWSAPTLVDATTGWEDQPPF